MALSAKARSDVAIGQLGGRDDRVLGDADLVVRFEGIAQAAQDHDGLRHRWLGHHDRLEAPLQRGVLLDVLLVLVERRRADQVQLTARHHRRRRWPHPTRLRRRLAGTYDGVHLVDEEDHLALVLGDLLQHLLHPLLELATVLRAGHHGIDVQLHQALVAQRLGTSPATMRCANPSTMAVLPTPGSPINTGLFFLRRASTSMVVSDFLRAADDRIQLARMEPSW